MTVLGVRPALTPGNLWGADERDRIRDNGESVMNRIVFILFPGLAGALVVIVFNLAIGLGWLETMVIALLMAAAALGRSCNPVAHAYCADRPGTSVVQMTGAISAPASVDCRLQPVLHSRQVRRLANSAEVP
jgi:hypothetical protein